LFTALFPARFILIGAELGAHGYMGL